MADLSFDLRLFGLGAARLMRGPRELVIVPGAGHLFEEPGTMDAVIQHAQAWFTQHLIAKDDTP